MGKDHLTKCLLKILLCSFISLLLVSLSYADFGDNADFYYKLNTTSGTTAFDETGNFNGEATVDSWGDGIEGNAFYSVGVGRIFLGTVKTEMGFGGVTAFSISTWVNMSSTASDQVIIGWDNANIGLDSRGDCANKFMFHWYTGGQNTLCGNVVPTVGLFYHIVLTYNSSVPEQKLYINGTLDKSGTTAGTITWNDVDANFGAIDGGGEPMTGGIDEVSVYKDKVLTQAEITTLYEEFRPPAPPPSGDVSPLNITLNQPNGTFVLNYDDIVFNWTAESNGTFTIACNLSLDGVVNETNVDSNNANATNLTITNLFDGVHAWSVNCSDSGGNDVNSTLISFTVDTTTPTIILGKNNAFNGSNFSNQNQYIDTMTLNITFADEREVFGWSINITKDGVVLFNESNTSVLKPNHTLIRDVDISSFDDGLYDISLSVSDSHTKYLIDDYKVSKKLTEIIFDTPEGNNIKLKTSWSWKSKYEKKRDRYSFGFDYILPAKTRTFTLQSNNEIHYLPNSEYKGHFVIWNPKTNTGNWLDFESEGTEIIVTRLNKNKYEIVVETLEDVSSLEFDSIGGLNTFREDFQWYRGEASLIHEDIVVVETSQTFSLNVTKQLGFLDAAEASLIYNGTTREVTKTDSVDASLFTSTFIIPSNEETYNLSWSINITQNSSNTYNFTLNSTQQVFFSILTISVFDERNQTFVVQNFTAFLTLEQVRTVDIINGIGTLGNLTIGEYFITAENSNYPNRGVFFTIENQSNSLTLYLGEDITGFDYIDFFVQDQARNNLNDIRMTFQKSINNSFVTVAQAETDFAGQVQIWLDQQNEYRIILSGGGFPEKIISLKPLQTEYTIFLDRVAESLYNNVWEGIRYTLFPRDRILNVSQTARDISLDILADDSSLQFFGLFIDNHNYTCVPTNCRANISGSPAGGLATVALLANATGSFDVHYFFKRSGFDTQYIHGTLYGVVLIERYLGENIANLFSRLKGDLGTSPMTAIIAAFSITAITVVASQLGVAGIGIAFVATLGNLLFTMAGFIDVRIGSIMTIIGIFGFIVFSRN